MRTGPRRIDPNGWARMLRRLAGLHTVGELELLTVDACERVAGTVLGLRESWIARNPDGTFFTLGVNAYMDLARAPEEESSYYGPAQRANPVLRDSFAEVHDALSAGLAGALDMPVRYADDLAMPGFHVWTSSGIPRGCGASVHFDLQYQRVLTRRGYAGATGTVSYTLPIRLPAAGSSLNVWPGFTFPDGAPHLDRARTTPPSVVEYHLGTALVHSGHVLHQIGPTRSVRPDDIRITLQGHGLVVNDELILYW